jgi:hypothetical protein
VIRSPHERSEMRDLDEALRAPRMSLRSSGLRLLTVVYLPYGKSTKEQQNR